MLREGGSAEQNIGTLNRDEAGNPRRADSLVKTRESREYLVEPGRYTIILKTDETGRRNAEGKPYEAFYLPPSAEFYEIHLYPSHEREARVSVSPANQPEAWDNLSLDAEFNLVFTQDMIAPLVEQNTSINDEYNNPIGLSFIWQGRRSVTLRPKKELTPAARYTIYVELEARDTEGDRLAEALVQEFYTTDITETAAIDLFTMSFDVMAGTIKMDWELPPNIGSELRIQGGMVTDLQAKTTWTFTDEEARTTPFKIVPYRMINNRKAYSQDAENAPYTTAMDLYRQHSDALEAQRAENAPVDEAMRQGQDFYYQGRYQEAIGAYGEAARLLESRNSRPPAAVYENIGHAYFQLRNYPEAVRAYEKALEADPGSADTRRFLEEAETAAKIAAEAAAQAAARAAAAAGWRAFFGRILNYEVYGGSSFTTPWAIIGINNRTYLFPHTFFETGCDFGFIPGREYQSSVSYYSIYPYGRFNVYLGTNVKLYAGAGGGWLTARYQDGGEDNRFSLFSFDLAAGLLLNISRHQGIAASYSLRSPIGAFTQTFNIFNTFNHKVTLGYLIHL